MRLFYEGVDGLIRLETSNLGSNLFKMLNEEGKQETMLKEGKYIKIKINILGRGNKKNCTFIMAR